MITELKPYPAYKNPGVDWLNKVPEEWDVLLSRRFCRIFAGATPSRDEPSYWNEGQVPWLASGDVNRRRISAASQFITDEGFQASSTKWIRPGSIVIALAGQGKTKGMAALVDIPATCNQSLGVLEPSVALCNSEFLLFYLESRYRNIRGLVGDLRDGLNLEHLKQMPVPIPPLAQQVAIARVLNYGASRIQQLMESKVRLIRLLEEEKQAITHRGITGGLDLRVPLRSSGVDWLGNIPEHWEILDLGRMIDLLPGYPFPSAEFSESEQDVRLLRGVNISPGSIRWDDVVRWPNELRDDLDAYSLAVGDLVLGLDRPLVRAGIRVARITDRDVPSLLLQRVARIRARPGLLSEYVELLLSGEVFKRYIAPIFTGISVPHLSPEQVRRFRIARPPVDEQSKIVKTLADETAIASKAIDVAVRQRELLAEYRARLISDVVTGKLDVREAAANLPDDPDADDLALDERLEEVAAG